MAIDADLNAGILTPEEAKDRRAEVAKEADFYGSMDGASKFVKGDAIAGILILVVNVVGGLIIGLLQHDLPIGQAAEAYILLAIGDGLVAQIPSLLLSIATAIIVTRVSSAHNMSEHITRQVNLSAAWFPTSLVILALGLVPGMPNKLFIFFTYLLNFFTKADSCAINNRSVISHRANKINFSYSIIKQLHALYHTLRSQHSVNVVLLDQ